MTKKYQTQFEINRTDLEIIERALRDQASKLCVTRIDHKDDGGKQEASNAEQVKERMSAIQSVLGKLHNQKIWFVPNETVPLG